jgi:hypothetical protein
MTSGSRPKSVEYHGTAPSKFETGTPEKRISIFIGWYLLF